MLPSRSIILGCHNLLFMFLYSSLCILFVNEAEHMIDNLQDLFGSILGSAEKIPENKEKNPFLDRL